MHGRCLGKAKETRSLISIEQEIAQRITTACFISILLFRSLTNGVYRLKYKDSPDEYQVYCHMSEIGGCEGKGWTLVMKMDGTKVKN